MQSETQARFELWLEIYTLFAKTIEFAPDWPAKRNHACFDSTEFAHSLRSQRPPTPSAIVMHGKGTRFLLYFVSSKRNLRPTTGYVDLSARGSVRNFEW